MVSIKKAISLVIISLLSFFLFAIEPNLIISRTFSKINNFDFNLSFENLTIENIYGDEILVELYSNNKKKLPFLNNANGTLKINSTPTQLYPSDYCNIKIYIPHEAVYETIYISTEKGQISIQSLKADEITIKSNTGKITADSLNADFSVQVSSTSAQIDINSTKNESLSIKNGSGSIYISSLTSDYFDVTTESGFIELKTENPPKATSKIISKTGDIDFSIIDKSGFDFIASSTSGFLRDEIAGLRLNPRNEYRNSYFDGGAEIHVRTSTGNITIK